MVRLVPAVLCICLATGAFAQDASAPTSSEAPYSATTADDAAGQPQRPVLPMLEAAAEPLVKTDLLSLVFKAHWAVQVVMGLLLSAMVAVLTVFLFKAVELTLAFSRLRRASAALASSQGLVPQTSACPLAEATRAAHAEVAGLPGVVTADLRASARERLILALDRIEARAVQRLRSGTGLLASIGAVAPFVGLFGTVIGIMNSFLAIAAAKTTSLVVVAPGIAEALLVTGVGLAAAIPAVLLYNRITRRIAIFRHRLADGTAVLLSRFSHALDARMGG